VGGDAGVLRAVLLVSGSRMELKEEAYQESQLSNRKDTSEKFVGCGGSERNGGGWGDASEYAS